MRIYTQVSNKSRTTAVQCTCSSYSSRDSRDLVVTEVYDDEALRLEQLIWNFAEVIVTHVLREAGREGE